MPPPLDSGSALDAHVALPPGQGAEAVQAGLAAEGIDVGDAQEALEQAGPARTLDNLALTAWAVGLGHVRRFSAWAV